MHAVRAQLGSVLRGAKEPPGGSAAWRLPTEQGVRKTLPSQL